MEATIVENPGLCKGLKGLYMSYCHCEGSQGTAKVGRRGPLPV